MRREVDALGDHLTIKIFSLLLLNLRWMKVDNNGGRKERTIELGMRFGRVNG